MTNVQNCSLTILSNLKSFGDLIKALMKTEDIMKSTSHGWLHGPVALRRITHYQINLRVNAGTLASQIYKLDLSRKKEIKKGGWER